MVKTEIDSIEIPFEFVELCRGWAGDTNCMLRAVDSTGGLTLGTRRPYSDDAGRPMSNEEWYVSLWQSLSSDIAYCARMAEKSKSGSNRRDAEPLREFEAFCDETVDRLRVEYGLTDSDVV